MAAGILTNETERRAQTVNFTYAFHRAELVGEFCIIPSLRGIANSFSDAGAFFNGVFLLALALSIFLQSIERFVNVEPVHSPC